MSKKGGVTAATFDRLREHIRGRIDLGDEQRLWMLGAVDVLERRQQRDRRDRVTHRLNREAKRRVRAVKVGDHLNDSRISTLLADLETIGLSAIEPNFELRKAIDTMATVAEPATTEQRRRLRRVYGRLVPKARVGRRAKQSHQTTADLEESCRQMYADVVALRKEWRGDLDHPQALSHALEVVAKWCPTSVMGVKRRTARRVVAKRRHAIRAAEALIQTAYADLMLPNIRRILSKSTHCRTK